MKWISTNEKKNSSILTQETKPKISLFFFEFQIYKKRTFFIGSPTFLDEMKKTTKLFKIFLKGIMHLFLCQSIVFSTSDKSVTLRYFVISNFITKLTLVTSL